MWDASEVAARQEQARAELDVILASAGFIRSQRMANLLRYLCNRYFAGQSDQVKEYNIAVEVFGRPATFDPVEDAIARVEVHRLRKKLREYYEKEGASHDLRLVIPTGSYVPAFQPAEKLSQTPDSALLQAVPLAVVNPVSLTPLLPPPPIVTGPAFSFPRFNWFSTLLVALVLTLIFVEIAFHFRSPAPVVGAGPSQGVVRTVDRNPKPAPDEGFGALPGRPVRVACGQGKPFRDRQGRDWNADTFFSGGSSFQRATPLLARAADPGLFQQGRSGLFGYDIPLQPGNYELHLFFAETEFGAGNPKPGGDGTRIFHVSANGRRILSDFDVLSDAGGPNIADQRVFKNVAPEPDGRLHLRFINHIGDALVNAIELVPARPGKLNPVRIVVQDQPVRDALGRSWQPDQFWAGGQIALHGGILEGSGDRRVYGNERFGNFSYVIPVAEDGSYDVSLYFAESYWGPENPGGGGVGSRLFDVFCNGEALLRNFDIYKEAGSSRSLVERFRGLHPSAQGKMTLSFVPVRNYASVYAVEVVDSSR